MITRRYVVTPTSFNTLINYYNYFLQQHYK